MRPAPGYILIGLGTLLALLAPATLAQTCAPNGWCVVEATDGTRTIYRPIDRKGSLVISREYRLDPDGTQSPTLVKAYNCRTWESSSELHDGEWVVIVPGSIGDGKARDLCSR
jgi:hypothetical protein